MARRLAFRPAAEYETLAYAVWGRGEAGVGGKEACCLEANEEAEVGGRLG